MRFTIGLVVLCGAWIIVTASPIQRSAIDAAIDTLGANGINTLQFTASSATFTVGQNFTPSDPWPRVTLKRYTVLLDYEHARMRQELCAKWEQRCRAAAACRAPASCVRFN